MAQTLQETELRAQLESAVEDVLTVIAGDGLRRIYEEAFSGLPNITALVGLAGSFNAAVTVRCEVLTARLLMARMLGLGGCSPAACDFAERDAGVADALGEICNMIAGTFKARVDAGGERCLVSIPSVVIGTDYEFRILTATDRVDLLYLFCELPLWVSLERRF